MTAAAGHAPMLLTQCKFSITIMIEGDLFPRPVRMAGLAFLAIVSFMHVIFLVARVTSKWRGPVLPVGMASFAIDSFRACRVAGISSCCGRRDGYPSTLFLCGIVRRLVRVRLRVYRLSCDRSNRPWASSLWPPALCGSCRIVVVLCLPRSGYLVTLSWLNGDVFQSFSPWQVSHFWPNTPL